MGDSETFVTDQGVREALEQSCSERMNSDVLGDEHRLQS